MSELLGLIVGIAAGAAFAGWVIMLDWAIHSLYWRIEKRRIVKNFKKSTYDLR